MGGKNQHAEECQVSWGKGNMDVLGKVFKWSIEEPTKSLVSFQSTSRFQEVRGRSVATLECSSSLLPSHPCSKCFELARAFKSSYLDSEGWHIPNYKSKEFLEYHFLNY